jgi:hypothetical protein
MTNLNSLQILWDKLHDYREVSEIDDYQWDSICEAMAHLHEELGVMHEEID